MRWCWLGLAVLSACAWESHWERTGTHIVDDPVPRSSSSLTTAVRAVVTVSPAGQLALRIDRDCLRTSLVEAHTIDDERLRGPSLARRWMGGIVGAYASYLGGGILLTSARSSDRLAQSFVVVGAPFLISGLTLVGLAIFSTTEGASRQTERSARTRVRLTTTACAAEPLAVTVRPPWGGELAGITQPDGTLRLTVDWTALRPPSAEALAAEWTIRVADATEIAWQPSGRDVARMASASPECTACR